MEKPVKQYKKSTIITAGADLKRSDPSSHYVNNEAFYKALSDRAVMVKEAKDAGVPVPRVSEYIGKCLFDVANRLSTKWFFQKYPFREDMVSIAVMHMLRYVDSFDVNVTKNPFSYFTQTAYFSFIDTIKKEKKLLASKFKMTIEALATQSIAFADDPDYHTLIAEENLPDISYMEDFVEEYEKGLSLKGAKINEAEAAAAEKKYKDMFDIAEEESK